MEKWLILGLGKGKYKISQQHLIISESKTVLKKRGTEKGGQKRERREGEKEKKKPGKTHND